jgi:tetratricopeptide (TPR) repeat protein
MKRTTVSFLVLAALALAVPARAHAASDEEEARGFYADGQRAFAAGHYGEAVNDYQRGYALVREPRFLFGMAHAYETLGDLPRAREYYRRFQAEAPKDDPDRGKAAAALAKLDPVGNIPPPKPYLDAGRTPEELKAALGDEEYERYVSSGLTLNGYRQREHGNKLAVEGIVTAVASLAVGVGLVLTSSITRPGQAIAGYCIAAVGTPIGFWIMRVGFSTSTMANFQVRPMPGTQLSYTDRAAIGNLSFSF